VSWLTQLRDRQLQVATIVVAIALAGSASLWWWLQPAPKVDDFVGPPRSGYTLTHFTLKSFDTDGLPSFIVTAPHLERRENDESLYINTPVYDLPSNQPGVPDWQGDSLYAWVDKGGDLLKLQGPVYMHRAAFADTAAAHLHTSEVTVWPKDNRMETAEAARMDEGATTMNGIGMRANLNDKHLELLDDSHGSFPPRKKR
jgi:lipopolysaccharide export system protein LptC